MPADTPAGLVAGQPPIPAPVGHDPSALADAPDDRVVVALCLASGPQHRVTRAAAGDVDAEQRPEERLDLPVAQPRHLVQVHGGGLGVGAELAGGRAKGVGGLKRMAALDPLSAAAAAAHLHVELPVDD